MKLLVLSDTQLGAGTALAVDRLADQEQILNRISDLADAHDVDAVVHCGDVFERRHPSEEERLVFKRWAKRIRSICDHDMIVVQGNHDCTAVTAAAAMDLYDECEFVREPRVVDLGGAMLACLPWAPVSGLVARMGGGDRDEVNAVAAAALIDIARELYEEAVRERSAGLPRNHDAPILLATHFWIEGATSATGAGEGVIHEPVLPIADLEAIGFDAVIAGHVHSASVLRELPGGGFIGYCGSPYVCSWGEAEQRHGVWLIDTERLSERRFVDLLDRPFATVSVDLTEEDDAAIGEHGLDDTDRIVAAIAEHYPLTDAVLRVQIRATEEQRRRVDEPALRALIADAGVHRLQGGIDWRFVRAERARVPAVNESLDPLAAVAAWCEANEVGEGQAAALGALTGAYVEALA